LNILGFDTASMAAYNFLNYEGGGSTFLWNVSVNLQVYMGSKHQKYNQKFHENIIVWYMYTECPRRNVPDFGRMFLMLKYTDITQNAYIQS
jgi:hypothetical protein